MYGPKEFVVQGQPERALSLIFNFIQSKDWPYPGRVNHARPVAGLHYVVYVPPSNALWRNPLGFVLIGALTVVTGGLFLLVYWLWRVEWQAEKIPRASVTATPETPHTTRLSLTADKQEWGETLANWIQRELVENNAAAPVTVEGAQQEPVANNVPEQIKKLAELRDSGAITEEEFQAKKKDLLDRI